MQYHSTPCLLVATHAVFGLRVQVSIPFPPFRGLLSERWQKGNAWTGANGAQLLSAGYEDARKRLWLLLGGGFRGTFFHIGDGRNPQISHQLEAMVETIGHWYSQGNHHGFLRWCRISSIHSMGIFNIVDPPLNYVKGNAKGNQSFLGAPYCDSQHPLTRT